MSKTIDNSIEVILPEGFNSYIHPEHAFSIKDAIKSLINILSQK